MSLDGWRASDILKLTSKRGDSLTGMTAFDNEPQARLLRALAEQLKVPLMHIARNAELSRLSPSSESLSTMEYTADMALRLIDSYLLSLRLKAIPVLELEPVSVSATLQDTAQKLNHLARQYDCDLDIRLSGKYGPVMAHRESIEAAYMSLGYAFIESAPANGVAHHVTFAAHRSVGGLVVGVFGDQPRLGMDMFRRARALYGTARQSFPALSGNNGAGVFVAEALLGSMEAQLRTAKHQKLHGLAATFLPSQQMQLV